MDLSRSRWPSSAGWKHRVCRQEWFGLRPWLGLRVLSYGYMGSLLEVWFGHRGFIKFAVQGEDSGF